MDDVGKAFVMVSHILLFIIACTVSITLYSKITNNIDEILLTSDYSNQGDSIIGTDEERKIREVSPAEVILAVLDLKNKTTGSRVKVKTTSTTRTYEYDATRDEIMIVNAGGSSFGFNTPNLYSELMQIKGVTKYKLTYSENELYYEKYD